MKAKPKAKLPKRCKPTPKVKPPSKPIKKETPKSNTKAPEIKKIETIKVNQTRKSLTPLKKKRSSEEDKELFTSHIRSKSMTDIDISEQMDFDQWNISEKMKNELMKKYKNLETQVKTLMLKEQEMNSIRKGMEKRASDINEMKRQKNQFKAEMRNDKALKKRKLNEQKQRINSIRDYELTRLNYFYDMVKRKRKLMCDINKADQNLMRTRLNQTMNNINNFNKSMYLKEKQHKDNFKQNKLEEQKRNEAFKKMMNKKNYERNLNTTDTLRQKMRKLEEIQSKYKNLLKDEHVKANALNHPVNYLNHTFYKGNENNDINNNTLNSGAYIHYSPMKRRKDAPLTPERNSKDFVNPKIRTCKTPLLNKKIIFK
ncbi:MAG: hypothetical protein MJ252_09000 [archaeon]|nr:hypothetical protein [archaeon]